MLKRKIVIVFALLVAVVIGGVLLNAKRVELDSIATAEIVYIYGGKNISQELTEEEIQELKSLFDGKRIYRDTPSCGFSEDISIKLDASMTFCIARDTCPVIYWKEVDRYFKITEEEQHLLYELLEKYGVTFPCI